MPREKWYTPPVAAEFGTTLTYLGRTEYWGNDSTGTDTVSNVRRLPGESSVIACCENAVNLNGMKRIPADLTAELWEYLPGGDPAKVARSGGANQLAVDSSGNVFASYQSNGVGALEAFNASGVLSTDASGTYRWHASLVGDSTIWCVDASEDGSVIVAHGANTWYGRGTNHYIASFDDTGAFIDSNTMGTVLGINSNAHHVAVIDSGGLAVFGWNSLDWMTDQRKMLVAVDPANLAGGPVWTFDKTLDVTTQFWTIARLLRRPDGGLLAVPGHAGNETLYFISAAGVLEAEMDLSAEFGTSGTSRIFRDACYDVYGHLYILQTASTGADIVRLDTALNVAWRASDTLAQASSTTDITTPLHSSMRGIAVGDSGIIFVGEAQRNTNNEGYIAGISQT